MEYKITNADICELAHQYTEQECIDKEIIIERYLEDTYTPEAQEIFDKHYKLITETLGV
jgi:biotin carboxylase